MHNEYAEHQNMIKSEIFLNLTTHFCDHQQIFPVVNDHNLK